MSDVRSLEFRLEELQQFFFNQRHQSQINNSAAYVSSTADFTRGSNRVVEERRPPIIVKTSFLESVSPILLKISSFEESNFTAEGDELVAF